MPRQACGHHAKALVAVAENVPTPTMGEPYEMVSINKTEPPAGAEGSDWHGYIITQGHNTIKGCRKGTLAVVTTEVEEIVERLNERRLHKRGRTHLVLKPKGPAAT